VFAASLLRGQTWIAMGSVAKEKCGGLQFAATECAAVLRPIAKDEIAQARSVAMA